MGGWLLGAIAGEFAAAWFIKKQIQNIFSIQSIILSLKGVIISKGRNMTSPQEYSWDQIDGFVRASCLLYLRNGVKRVEFQTNSENEAEWLQQRLNALCEEFTS